MAENTPMVSTQARVEPPSSTISPQAILGFASGQQTDGNREYLQESCAGRSPEETQTQPAETIKPEAIACRQKSTG